MEAANLSESALARLRKAFELEEAGKLDEAVAEFRVASRLGSTDAKSKLGTIYGDVIKPAQPDKAVYWYRKGVEAGDPSCAWNLAMHYGGRQNRRWYRYWLETAARMGDPDARAELEAGTWWSKFSERA